MSLFKRKERFLGIDISPSAIKLIELSRSGQRFQVEAVAIEALPEGAMADRNPNDPEQVASAIKRAIKSSGTRLKSAAVAVPTSSVITRTIPMPASFSEEEIETNLQIEAAQYIPFPLEEIYMDFQILGTSKADSTSQDVMLVASRKENVDLREECLKEAGLKPVVVDVEAYALENTFGLLGLVEEAASAPTKDGKGMRPGRTGHASATAVVDIGASITTLYVFQGERVIFTREQSFGGEQLTTAIADTYGLSRDKAELAKRSGEIAEDYPITILEPFRQSTAEQVGNALQFFFSSSHYNTVERIVLTGGGALVDGLDKAVAASLGIPTFVANPFEQMASAKGVNRRSLMRDAPLFAVACGLALRSFE
ncbi:MAG TPA: pilus assembly protein PilM [Candidatus Competibacteraceae bacterium]|nr:pilus assembly protein PilM [Candidatus Competibacteraceae bacterium]